MRLYVYDLSLSITFVLSLYYILILSTIVYKPNEGYTYALKSLHNKALIWLLIQICLNLNYLKWIGCFFKGLPSSKKSYKYIYLDFVLVLKDHKERQKLEECDISWIRTRALHKLTLKKKKKKH